MAHSLIFVWFSLIFIVRNVLCVSPTIRSTTNGPIDGIELSTSLGQPYYAFKGIRFAEAPITGTDPLSGQTVDRRFKAPEPLKHTWSDPLKVRRYGKGCMQSPSILTNSFYLSEDCLFLNVYVPYGGSEEKPVLIYFHGGGWVNGDASDLFYGPDFLLSQDVVLVTVQYRLGIFGLLNLDTGAYTGNMALKDQQLALKWVWNNIESFAGDKQKILIFGESAGAAAVHFHMLNKESRPYFNRAFASSGSALNAWQRKNHMPLIQECSNLNGTNEIIKYLKTASSQRLLQCKQKNAPGSIDQAWLPTIESPQTRGAFLTQPPDEIYESNPPLPIHTMFSFNSQEALIDPKYAKSTEPLIKADWRETNFPLPFKGFTKEAFPKEYKTVVEKLRAAYYPEPTNDRAIRDGNIALLTNLYVSDSELQSIALQADVNSRQGSMNTYFFRFSVHDAFNLIELISHVPYEGAAHTDDVCYMFHCHILDLFNVYGNHLRRQDKSYDLIIRSVKLVSNFARIGDPSIKGDTPFKSSKSSNEIYCQEISNATKTSVTNDIKKQLHYDLWLEIEQIYKSLNIPSDGSKKTVLTK